MNKSYYAAIITAKRNLGDQESYDKMANLMVEVASAQKGFRGIDAVSGADGVGIVISYWDTLEDISNWKSNYKHQTAQKLGRSHWYSSYTVRICKIEREYSFDSKAESTLTEEV